MVKVVRRLHGTNKRVSVSVESDSKISIEYTPGKWVEGKLGPILCFAEYKNAKDLGWDAHPFLEIWRVEAKDQVDLPCYLVDFTYFVAGTKAEDEIVKAIINLWKFGKGDNPIFDEDPRFIPFGWPPGTLAFKKVKLLERIK